MLNFLQFALTHLFGVLTPGPGFLLVAENAVMYGIKKAMLTSLSLNSAYIIHLSFITWNLNHDITNQLIWNIFNLISGTFILYLAYGSLKNKNVDKLAKMIDNEKIKISKIKIFTEGFVIGIFNSKGFLLFTFLLKTFSNQNNVIYYAAWIPFALTIIHLTMAYCMTRNAIRLAFLRNIKVANKIFALLLLIFSIKIYLNIKF